MKRFIFIIAVLFTAFQASIQAQNPSNEIKEKPEVQKESYACPMHPEVTSDQPGNCTKCNLKMVKQKSKNYKGHDTETTQMVYSCPMHPEVSSEKAGTCPKCQMALVQKEVKNYKGQVIGQESGYVCPMHPEMKSAKPGKCPACNMAMVETKTNNNPETKAKNYKGHPIN